MSRIFSAETSIRRLVVAALLMVVLGGPTVASAGDEIAVRRFALIVGSNDGGGERAELRYAQSDAYKFSELVQDLGGVDSRDMLLLLNPDVAAVTNGFEALSTLIADEDSARVEVIFYYSGHSDEQGLLLSGELLRFKDLRQLLSDVPADVRIVVLDSCFAGSLTRTKGGVHRPPFLIDEAVDVTGHAFLTSSSEDEVAQESDRIEGSFFPTS